MKLKDIDFKLYVNDISLCGRPEFDWVLEPVDIDNVGWSIEGYLNHDTATLAVADAEKIAKEIGLDLDKITRV